MATPQGERAPEKPDDFGASLMKVLEEDLHQLRVGNAAPETVPVFKDHNASRAYVRFADLSTNVRRILDMCPEVEIRIDGKRFDGERGFQEIGGWRSPVLQWEAEGDRVSR